MGINYLLSIKTLFIFQILLFVFGTFLSLKTKLRINENRKLPLPIKMVISLSLTMAAFLIVCYGNKQTFYYSFFILFGMIFSFIGDLTMARVIKFNNRLNGGIIFFSIAHGFYIIAYMVTMLMKNIKIEKYLFFSACISLLFFIICSLLFRKKTKQKNQVRIYATLYGTWIAFMAAMAFSLAFSIGHIWWITFISAIIFMISDLIIAVKEIININIKNSGILVWATYIAAQMGIVYVVVL